MRTLADIATKVRSKNAGPFWLTVDIFCGSSDAYALICDRLQTAALAKAFQLDPVDIKRFDIADLNVVKISLPRPAIQGTAADRDMHGASFSQIVSALEI